MGQNYTKGTYCLLYILYTVIKRFDSNLCSRCSLAKMEDAVQCAPMASTGSAKSTERGRSAAKNHCDLCCASKHLPKTRDLSGDQFCDVHFFREFATYLTEHASEQSQTLLMARTAVQYLSAIKDSAIHGFPENEFRFTN